jgi:hypothetical protein
MNHIFAFLLQDISLLRSLMDVAVMFACGAILYILWEKVLGH